jgi:hypothetical protein
MIWEFPIFFAAVAIRSCARSPEEAARNWLLKLFCIFGLVVCMPPICGKVLHQFFVQQQQQQKSRAQKPRAGSTSGIDDRRGCLLK